ncbi:uncharacterized protein LOC122650494 [Telopea speciosissima]|uniref:uncharacterized protein LOC122650494 n=1 Tax=Telopea speciosissima TaxID=54955 RepID=UPI001CC6083B|nr:uncharacterized protein LOC122650494 [Telopea speciosissima]
MEVLSRLLNAYRDLDLFRGIKVARGVPEITHLFFADDIFIFYRAFDDLRTVKAVLDLFSDLSGQEINFEKSGIYFSRNVTPLEQRRLGAILGIPLMNPSAMYLGRSVLIKSVLSSMPTYQMSYFFFLDIICKKIDFISYKFWCGGSQEESRSALISWKKMSSPKFAGGLGFRPARVQNVALLCRLGWRLLTEPHSVWARVLKARYYPSTSLFDPTTAVKRGSWVWNSIAKILKYLRSFSLRIIGNGTDTYFWTDPWIPSIPHFTLKPSESQRTYPEKGFRLKILCRNGNRWIPHVLSVAPIMRPSGTYYFRNNLIFNNVMPDPLAAVRKIELWLRELRFQPRDIRVIEYSDWAVLYFATW